MFSRPWFARTAAAGTCLALLLTACELGDTEQTDQQDDDTVTEEDEADTAENPIPEPEYEDDDTVRLPIGLVSPAGHSEAAPIGEDGQLEGNQAPGAAPGTGAPQMRPHQTEIARSATFGCEDTISVVRTVPMVTEEPATSALEFLFADDSYEHGDPAFINALAVSSNLAVDNTELNGDTVTVELTGQPTVRSGCESWQLLKQIETTARLATGASRAEITVDGVSLAELLGLATEDTPLEIYEIEPEVD
nr:GerMN domain-containing protein [Nesterenkonia alba]